LYGETDLRVWISGALRDRLIAAVLGGAKTATSSLLVEWEQDGEQPSSEGELQTVIDSAGVPVAIIEILKTLLQSRQLGTLNDRPCGAECIGIDCGPPSPTDARQALAPVG
jgi:hypothetical protein